MSISIDCDNDLRSALRFDVENQSDWNEFHRAVETANALIRSTEGIVDLIIYAHQRGPRRRPAR